MRRAPRNTRSPSRAAWSPGIRSRAASAGACARAAPDAAPGARPERRRDASRSGARREALYGLNRLRCHGIHADAGILPDLRYSAFILDAAAFRTVVMDGALAGRGTVACATSLSAEDAETIRGYLLRQAARQRRGQD